MRNLIAILFCVLCSFTTTHAATFDKTDLTVVSDVNETKLHTVLKVYKIEHLTSAAIKAEKKYGVNVFSLLAIGAWESAWYTKPCGTYNYHGQIGLNFKSVEAGFMEAARNLKENYLDSQGEWHKGTSLKSIAPTWCPTDSKEWNLGITSIANQLKNDYNKLK